MRDLLYDHLAFAHDVTPVEHVHALSPESLLDPAATLYSARRDGVLLGVGALNRLDDDHAELKSMHTRESARGQGVALAMVRHLLHVAREENFGRVSLETGTHDAFAPARMLYAKVGFTPCPPFADYTDNPHSVCMSITLASPRT